MELYELIDRTLDYRWDWGAHNTRFPAHRYPNDGSWQIRASLVMVCPHEGPYSVLLRDSKVTHTIQKNEVVVIPGGTALRVRQAHPGRQSYAHLQFTILGTFDPLTLFDLPSRFQGRDARPLRDALWDLTEAHRHPITSLSIVARRKESAFRLFHTLLAHATLKPDRADLLKRYPRIQAAIEYVGRNLANEISRDHLAELTGLSPSRFSTLFREIMGLSPHAYIQEQRQRLAVKLVLDATRSMAAIAHETGYCDQFEFSRRFKKRWGASPLSYRKTCLHYEQTLIHPHTPSQEK